MAAKPAPKAAQPHAQKHEDGLHYNKTMLLADYQDTFKFFIRFLMIGILGALAYFFAVMIYLGGWGQTKGNDYAKEFLSRYPVDYSGKKIPEFGGPATPEAAPSAEPAAK